MIFDSDGGLRSSSKTDQTQEAKSIVERLGYQDYSSQRSNNSSSSPSKLPTSNEPTEKQWRSIVASVNLVEKHPYETLRIALLDVSWQKPSFSQEKRYEREFNP